MGSHRLDKLFVYTALTPIFGCFSVSPISILRSHINNAAAIIDSPARLAPNKKAASVQNVVKSNSGQIAGRISEGKLGLGQRTTVSIDCRPSSPVTSQDYLRLTITQLLAVKKDKEKVRQ